MTLTTNYLIEPLAPLVFRSGKPFGSQASAADVIFPMPSAAAGLIRATCINQKQAKIDEHSVEAVDDQSYQQVLSIKSTGPYLARFDESLQHVEILVPKPADAIYFEAKSDNDGTNEGNAKIELVRLAPKALDPDCGSDLPEGLLPVQMEKTIKGKPKPGVAYWTLEHLKKWQAGHNVDFDTIQKSGITQLPIDLRTHVAIDSQSKATKTGQLFQTASFDFGYAKAEAANGRSVWQDNRLGFIVQTEQSLDKDMVTFGGERRLSKLSSVNTLESFYDDTPEQLLKSINEDKGFRLTFLTPCIFANGYLPTWLDATTKKGMLPNTNSAVSLKACAIDKWQAVSGWDSILWKPKAMRKAISSGSVYWFALDDKISLSDLEQILHHVWSDDSQDKNDGFGSAIIAPWKSNS
jgi:CRISPR-associated protein Cmr3